MKLAEFVGRLEREASDAERYETTARVDVVLRSVIEDLKKINGTEDTAQHSTEPERMINVHEAATILGVKVRWLYDNYHRFPFYRRIGRQLRFSKRGITRYLERRR